LYGSYPTEFAGSTQNPKKNHRNTKSTYQNENFPKKNYVSYLKSVKKPKIRGGYPTEFAGSTQNVKKNCRSTKSINQNKNVPKKSMFSALKVQRSQKFLWKFLWNPTEFAGLIQNPKKNDRNTKSTNQKENFPLKV
jgi:hypothetical protein